MTVEILPSRGVHQEPQCRFGGRVVDDPDPASGQGWIATHHIHQKGLKMRRGVPHDVRGQAIRGRLPQALVVGHVQVE